MPLCPGGRDVATGGANPPTCGIIEVESNQRNYLQTRDLTRPSFIYRLSGLSTTEHPTVRAHLHLVQRLRIDGAVLLLPLYTLRAWTGIFFRLLESFHPDVQTLLATNL